MWLGRSCRRKPLLRYHGVLKRYRECWTHATTARLPRGTTLVAQTAPPPIAKPEGGKRQVVQMLGGFFTWEDATLAFYGAAPFISPRISRFAQLTDLFPSD